MAKKKGHSRALFLWEKTANTPNFKAFFSSFIQEVAVESAICFKKKHFILVSTVSQYEFPLSQIMTQINIREQK